MSDKKPPFLLPLDKLIVNRDSLFNAHSNVTDSRNPDLGSRTPGPVQVWGRPNGEYLLTDGHHRLAAHLLSGKHGGSVPVKVIGDGDTDYWHVPSDKERIRLDPKKKYGGIESRANRGYTTSQTIRLFDRERGKKLEFTPENEDLEKSKLKAGLLAVGLATGLGAPKTPETPTPEPQVSVNRGPVEMTGPQMSVEIGKPTILSRTPATPGKWNPTGLVEDMHPIAHLESSWGKNMSHAAHSKGDYHTAVGAVGLKPITAHEQYRRTPALQEAFPNLQHDAEAFTQKLKTDPEFYNRVASAHWNTLKNRFGTPERTAYAWRWGWGSARNASDEDIANDSYVQKYQALSEKLGKGELAKGSFQGRHPYNPESDQHAAIRDWQNHADASDRDRIPRLEGNGRTRALQGLHSRTATRRNPTTNEREFLLHRGYGAELQHQEGRGAAQGSPKLSWTSNLSVAAGFGSRAKGVVSAWIPESGIHHVLRQTNGRANDTEEEVVVDHSSVPTFDIHHVMSPDQTKHVCRSIPTGTVEEAGRTGRIDGLFLNKSAQAAPAIKPEEPASSDQGYSIVDKPVKSKARPTPRSNLVAVHSLEMPALDSALKEGRIPSPSIAIINTDTADEDTAGFGSIKLIGKQHLADPNRGSLVFDADAYTARHPNTREVISTKGKDGDELNRFFYDKAKRDSYAELEAGLGKEHAEDILQTIAQRNTADFVDKAKSGYRSILWTKVKQHLPVGWHHSVSDDFTSSDFNILDSFAEDAGLDKPRITNTDRAVFLFNNADKISKWLDSHPVLSQWLPQVNKTIRRKDGTEIPYSPEAALKEMTGKPVRGAERPGSVSSLGNVRAQGAKRFKTLAEMRESAKNIISPSDARRAFNETDDKFRSLFPERATHLPVKQAIAQAYKTKDLEGAVRDHELDNYVGMPEDYKERIKLFMQSLVDSPTEYFEAKPQRLVNLNEFAAALVPHHLLGQYKDRLAAHGIKAIPYRGDHTAALKHYTHNQDLRLSEKSMRKNEENPKQVVSIACFNSDGNVLFGLRGDSGRWCMPGGSVEDGEDIRKAAIRELLEETGLKPTNLSFLGSRVLRMGGLVVHSFRADVSGVPDASNDPDKEFYGFVWADAANPPRTIADNLHNNPDITLDFLNEKLEDSLAKSVLDPNSGYDISVKHLDPDTKRTYPVTQVVTSLRGKRVAEAVLAHLQKGVLHPEHVLVYKDHRRKGIASAMYRVAENATGRKVVPGPAQTTDGKKFWEGNQEQGQFGLRKDEPKQAELFPENEVTQTPAGKSNLAVVHNISHDKLEDLHKLGGKAPAPSIAVAHTSHGLDDFGSITLIGHPDMVDPQKGVPVYDADAYTPRHPRIKWRDTVPEMDSKKRKVVLDYLHQSLARWKETSPFEKPTSLTETMTGVYKKNLTPAALMPLIHDFMLETNRYEEGRGPPESQIYDEWYGGNKLRAEFMEWMDRHPTLSIVSKLRPQADIVDHEYSTPIAMYTPKRALREMQRRPIRGGEGAQGFGAMRALGAKRFKSLAEIRASASRIRSREDTQAIYNKTGDDYDTLAQDLWLSGEDEDGMRFTDTSRMPRVGFKTKMTRALKEHLKGANIRTALARHGLPTLSDEAHRKLEAWAKGLVDSPTNYFEAKPQRVVDLREFRAALVHKDGMEHAKPILDKYKIRAIPYDNDEHRKQILAQFTQENNLRLSEKDPSQS